MDAVVEKLLSGVRLGAAVKAGALTLLPVFASLPPGPAYVTLGEAMAAGTLRITEVDQGGSVPELRASNNGKASVLILDGEELSGAKQNRVLNTTVLLAAGKEILLPVSCTERGRWSYLSASFGDSGYVASHAVRRAVHESVTASVRSSGAHRSDQGRVWGEVDDVSARAGVRSATGAMRDVFEQRRKQTDDLTVAIVPLPEQVGVMAVADGAVMGLDLVSRAEAYAKLHDKIVRSYGFEAVVDGRSAGKGDVSAAKAFMAELGLIEGSEHASPGTGKSHRFTGRGIVGSALTYRSAIVHAAFFTADAAQGGGMAPWGRRAGFRASTRTDINY
jgi:hypothetical protein